MSQPTGEELAVKVGDRMLVFDGKAWWPLGDQPDGNAQFWKPATIERLYHNGWDRSADIRWDDGTTSTGHIVSAMKPLSAVSR